MDNQLKEDRELLSEVIKLTEKRPYPDKETIHLAKFIDACFCGFEEAKKKELQEKEEILRKKQLQEAERLRRKQELQRKQELETEAPSPMELPSDVPPPLLGLKSLTFEAPSPPDLPSLDEIPSPPSKTSQKREYVLQIYNNPVGVFVDKENNIYTYHSIEPVIKKSIIEQAKSMYGQDLEKNPSLFSDQAFFQRLSDKVANKTKSSNIPMFTQKLLYFLQRDIIGAGPFDPLLYDEKIKAIYCDGPNKTIRIDYDNLGQMNTNIIIPENTTITTLLKRLALAAGKRFDEKNPILDITFQGLRFEALIGQGGTNTKVTIRRL
jgi:hypothetical protein